MSIPQLLLALTSRGRVLNLFANPERTAEPSGWHPAQNLCGTTLTRNGPPAAAQAVTEMSESAEPGNRGFVTPAMFSPAPAPHQPAHTTTAPTRPWTTSSEELRKPEDAGLQSTDPDKHGFVGGLQSELAFHSRRITGLTGRKRSRNHPACGRIDTAIHCVCCRWRGAW